MKNSWIFLSLFLAVIGSAYASSGAQAIPASSSRKRNPAVEDAGPESKPESVMKTEDKPEHDNTLNNLIHSGKTDDADLDEHSPSDDIDTPPKYTKTFSKSNKKLTTPASFHNHSNNGSVAYKKKYEVKHYLTAEQKYYMLRINLLGIGIHVVHDIIPIPILITDQYKKSMESLLAKIEATRMAAANGTLNGMRNITLEDASRLQKAMALGRASAVKAKKGKKESRTSEILIIVGVVVGLTLIAIIIWACKKSNDAKPHNESSYYDPIRPNTGLAMN